MARKTVEDIKFESNALRGTIIQTLQSEVDHFSEADYQLLKFHGSYQQDDRDLRTERKRAGLEKAYQFMVRNKMAGGDISAEQYIAHDRIAGSLSNGTLRITSRQGIQFHGILKKGLRETIASIEKSGLTTSGACGDVVRNTMAPSAPFDTPEHRDAEKLAHELARKFLARTTAYMEIWINGEKVDLEGNPNPHDEEPVYGQLYLPRKFKIGIAIPPRNDVDIYTQDLGLVPNLENGEVEGYTVLVGGGFGMGHGKMNTRPFLAQPLFYVGRADVIDAAVAIVATQRDFGRRDDRAQARLKYLIADKGLAWFRSEVESRMSAPTEEAKPLIWNTVQDCLGWHEQGDGRMFVGVWVNEGRIVDTNIAKYRTGFRTIFEKFGVPARLTPNTNILFYNIDPSQRDDFQATLEQFGIAPAESLTEARKTAHACVALPTCGLALSESERIFPALMDEIDNCLREFGLEKEPLLIRMTGCPNGCARPYNADISFVGRAPNKFAVFAGGSSSGERLGGLEQKVATLEELPDIVRGYLKAFTEGREAGESFTAWWGRTRTNGEEPTSEQFHLELAERSAKLAAATAG
jgi:sulfite reductase (ferredoxin)